MTRRVW